MKRQDIISSFIFVHLSLINIVIMQSFYKCRRNQLHLEYKIALPYNIAYKNVHMSTIMKKISFQDDFTKCFFVFVFVFVFLHASGVRLITPTSRYQIVLHY